MPRIHMEWLECSLEQRLRVGRWAFDGDYETKREKGLALAALNVVSSISKSTGPRRRAGAKDDRTVIAEYLSELCKSSGRLRRPDKSTLEKFVRSLTDGSQPCAWEWCIRVCRLSDAVPDGPPVKPRKPGNHLSRNV